MANASFTRRLDHLQRKLRLRPMDAFRLRHLDLLATLLVLRQEETKFGQR